MKANRQYLHDFMIKSPLHQWLGCEVSAYCATSGMVTVRLPFRQEILSDPDGETVHGGMVATLADLAAHAAVHAAVDRGVPTIDLRVDYLRAAVAPLEAKAQPRRIGRTIGFVDVEIYGRDGKLAAIGRSVFATVAPNPRSRS